MRQQPPPGESPRDEAPGSQQASAPRYQPTQPYQAQMHQPSQGTAGSTQVQSRAGGRRARSGKQRLGILLLILCGILVLSAGILTALLHFRQSQQASPWVHLPPGAKPTAPTNGYLFKDPTGGYVVYTFPATPPTTIMWQTYHNTQDAYTINIPSQWIKVQAAIAGHTGFLFYPPGTKSSENVPGGPDGVGFRWTDQYQSPASTDQTITDKRSVTVDGITGQLYTQGSLGNTIVVTFPYKQGHFILTANADTDVLISVFQHMLQSLKFT